MPPVTITPLLSPRPSSASFTGPPPHHVGNPPTSFTNPWPSFHGTQSLLSVLQTRFFAHDRHFVPVPADRAELVPVQRPNWGAGKTGLKATWIGHASFVVETRDLVGKGEAEGGGGGGRGVRVLFDPVWSERMSPVSWAGPKRFSPVPCAIDECPEVDVVCISHNHYDHLDADTIAAVHRRGGGRVRFLCPLGIKRWFLSMGIREEEVAELDWWDGVLVDVEGVGSVRLVCTPSQHFSGRGVWDHGGALWCSWVLEETTVARDGTGEGRQISAPRKLFFAGGCARQTPQGHQHDHEHRRHRIPHHHLVRRPCRRILPPTLSRLRRDRQHVRSLRSRSPAHRLLLSADFHVWRALRARRLDIYSQGHPKQEEHRDALRHPARRP